MILARPKVLRIIMRFCAILAISSLLVSQSWCLTDDEIAQFVSRPYVEHNTGLQGTVSVTYGNDPTKLILQANGIPDHDTGMHELYECIFYSYIVSRNHAAENLMMDSHCAINPYEVIETLITVKMHEHARTRTSIP